MPLLKNVRFYVLCLSLTLSLAIYLWVKQFVPPGILQTIRLTQIYALTAASYLYVALLIGPLVYRWHSMPARGHVYRARRAIGVSAFYFACLHSYLAFFKQLGGFTGLGFLPGNYLIAISLSFTALLILAAMASTSFDKAIQRLTFRRWKFLHRFIYLAATLILIHALMLGTHFQDLSGLIPQTAFVLIAFLLILQAQRFDAWLPEKFPYWPRQPFSLMVVIVLITFWLALLFFPAILPSLGIHSRHAWLGKQALAHVPMLLLSRVKFLP